jgi:hypothetical protein
VAIRTKDANIVRSVVLPIAVNMLDLERDETCMRIALAPTAALTFFSNGLNDVPTNGAVEVEPWWKLTRAPQ